MAASHRPASGTTLECTAKGWRPSVVAEIKATIELPEKTEYNRSFALLDVETLERKNLLALGPFSMGTLEIRRKETDSGARRAPGASEFGEPQRHDLVLTQRPQTNGYGTLVGVFFLDSWPAMIKYETWDRSFTMVDSRPGEGFTYYNGSCK